MSVDAPAAARLVVVGAGAGPLRRTVALNVAAAAAATGVPTLLHDLGGGSSLALARVVGPDGLAALPWAAAPLHVAGPADPVGPHGAGLVVVDPPPRLDGAVLEELGRADAVLVPMDATPIARRALREVAARVAERQGAARLHVVLARTLPRDADRWALLEEIEALAPDALLATTLPAGRPHGPAEARLYAPGTRAAAAYAAVHAAIARALPERAAAVTSTSP